MATIEKSELKRLVSLYADRLTRNVKYRIADMPELTELEVWQKASGEHRRFLRMQVLAGAITLLRDAGFPAGVFEQIRDGER